MSLAPLRAPVAALAAAGLLACAGDLVTAPLPDLATAKAVVIALEDGGPPALWAYDLPHADLSLPIGADGRVTALLYDAPLEAHALPSGPLALATSDRTRPLPPPTAIRAAELEAGAIGDWREEASLSVSLAAVRLDDTRETAPCSTLELSPLAELGRPSFGFAVDDHLVVAGAAGYFHVYADRIERFELTSSPPAPNLGAAARIGEDAFVVGSFGALYRGELARPGALVAVPGTEQAEDFYWMAGSGTVAFGFNRRGRLVRFDGALTDVAFVEGPSGTWNLGGLAALSSDVALVGRDTQNVVTRWEASRGTTTEALPSSVFVSAVSLVPGLGVYVGAVEGGAFERRGATYAELGAPFSRVPVRAFGALEGRLVAGSHFGFVAEQRRGGGWCDPIDSGLGEIRSMVAVGPELFVLGDGVVRLRRR